AAGSDLAEERVEAETADEEVAALATGERIAAVATEQHVVAQTAADSVVARAGVDIGIERGVAADVDGVVARTAVDVDAAEFVDRGTELHGGLRVDLHTVSVWIARGTRDRDGVGAAGAVDIQGVAAAEGIGLDKGRGTARFVDVHRHSLRARF